MTWHKQYDKNNCHKNKFGPIKAWAGFTIIFQIGLFSPWASQPILPHLVATYLFFQHKPNNIPVQFAFNTTTQFTSNITARAHIKNHHKSTQQQQPVDHFFQLMVHTTIQQFNKSTTIQWFIHPSIKSINYQPYQTYIHQIKSNSHIPITTIAAAWQRLGHPVTAAAAWQRLGHPVTAKAAAWQHSKFQLAAAHQQQQQHSGHISRHCNKMIDHHILTEIAHYSNHAKRMKTWCWTPVSHTTLHRSPK